MQQPRNNNPIVTCADVCRYYTRKDFLHYLFGVLPRRVVVLCATTWPIGARYFHCTQRLVAPSLKALGEQIAAWLDRAESSSGLLAQIRSLGVTHVLIHKKWYQVRETESDNLTMLEKEFVLRASKRSAEHLRSMLDESAALRYNDEVYLIYELIR